MSTLPPRRTSAAKRRRWGPSARRVVAVPVLAGAMLLLPVTAGIAHAEPGDASTYGGDTSSDTGSYGSDASDAGSYGSDASADTSSDVGSYAGSESGTTGFEGSPEMGPAHAEAVNSGADSYDGGSVAADTSSDVGAYGGSDSGTTGFEGSPEMGPAHAEAVNSGADSWDGGGGYAGSESGTTGFEGSPEMGPAHAEAVNSGADAWTGASAAADPDPTGMAVDNPEMGPAHAQAVNSNADVWTGASAPQVRSSRTDGLPQGLDLGMGTTLWGPFGAEVNMYMDWDRIQFSTFAGMYLGARIGAELRDPRPLGLSYESTAAVNVGPGRIGATYEVFEDGRAVVNARANIANFGYTVPVQIGPEVEVLDPRYAQNAPVPVVGLGINATAGYRHTHEYDISHLTGPARAAVAGAAEAFESGTSYAWDSFVDAWNDLQEAVHGERPDGPCRTC